MTTLIKGKLKKLDDQTNIEKYRIAANITEYHIMYIKIYLPNNHHSKFITIMQFIISCKEIYVKCQKSI